MIPPFEPGEVVKPVDKYSTWAQDTVLRVKECIKRKDGSWTVKLVVRWRNRSTFESLQPAEDFERG